MGKTNGEKKSPEVKEESRKNFVFNFFWRGWVKTNLFENIFVEKIPLKFEMNTEKSIKRCNLQLKLDNSTED